MTPQIRHEIVQGRLNNYNTIMLTVFFTFTGAAAVIELGSGAYSAPLTMLVIAITAYGILAGGAALDDLIALREDMDDEMAASAYGKSVLARNVPMLKNISAVLVGLIGLAELYGIVV